MFAELAPFLAFAAAVGVLTVTPGVDTATVMRASAVLGPRGGAAAALGVCAGLGVWGAGAALGLAALVAGSPAAFAALKFAGAAYLLWLGVRLILRPRARLEEPARPDAASAAAPFRQGLLTNLLNPKVGVFYVSFLPQFVPAGASVAAYSAGLAGLHVVMAAAWFAALIRLTTAIRGAMTPRVVMSLDRASGGVFVAFGAKLALAAGG